MPIIRCPSCQSHLNLPDDLRSPQVRCPKCQAVFAPASFDQPTLDVLPAGETDTGFDAPDVPSVRRRRRRREEFTDQLADVPAALPGGGLVTAVIVLLVLSAVMSVLGMVVAGLEYAHYSTINAAQLAREAEEPTPLDAVIACNGLLHLVVYLTTAVVFCCWVYRAHANLRLLRVKGMQHTPGWAVGYFFIPILNLFRPYQAMQEVYKASDPAVDPEDPRAWKHSPGAVLIGLWWACWLISNITGQVSFRVALRSDPTPQMLAVAALADIVSEIAALAAAFCVIAVILAIRQRQTQRFELLYGAAPDDDRYAE